MLIQQIKCCVAGAAVMLITASILVVCAGMMNRPELSRSEYSQLVIPGDQLKPVVGKTEIAGDIVKLSSLINGIAVIRYDDVHFSASAFSYITLEVEGLAPLLSVELFWRNKGQVDSVYTLPIYQYGTESVTLHLAREPRWSGEIVEIGLSFNGEINQPFFIKFLQLESWSILTWAKSIWDQWWAYGGWKGTSINFTSGGRFDKVKGIDGPEILMVPAVGFWLVLSVLIYIAYTQILRIKIDKNLLLFMLFSAWFVLDSRWLHELWRRTQFVEYQYLGKTQHQKWQKEIDSEWYKMTLQIKQLIPEQSVRIFQVLKTRKPLDDYYRYRVRYHLLPHNVFPYLQTLPKRSQIKHGDYILDLGRNSELKFDSDSHQLVNLKQPFSSIQSIILKYQSPLGRLYQYQGD